jgi:hypothetical protein
VVPALAVVLLLVVSLHAVVAVRSVVAVAVLGGGFGDHNGGDRHAVRVVPDLVAQELLVHGLTLHRLGERRRSECNTAQHHTRRYREVAHDAGAPSGRLVR